MRSFLIKLIDIKYPNNSKFPILYLSKIQANSDLTIKGNKRKLDEQIKALAWNYAFQSTQH